MVVAWFISLQSWGLVDDESVNEFSLLTSISCSEHGFLSVID